MAGILFISDHMNSGKSTAAKNAAAYTGAENITINTRKKDPNGEDARFFPEDMMAFSAYLDLLHGKKRSFIAEIGGDVLDTWSKHQRQVSWPAYIDCTVCVFNVNGQAAPTEDVLTKLEFFKLTLDRLTVVLNMVTKSKLELPAVKRLIGFCEDRSINICPAVIPECEVFRIQDGNNQSIWQLGKENTYDNAAREAKNAVIDKRPGSEILELCRQKVAYFYIDLINQIVLPPLFNHINGMIAHHG